MIWTWSCFHSYIYIHVFFALYYSTSLILWMLPRDILPLIFHLSSSLLILPTESCVSKALKFNYQLLKFSHIKRYKTTIVYQTTIKTGVDYNILGSYSCSFMCACMIFLSVQSTCTGLASM